MLLRSEIQRCFLDVPETHSETPNTTTLNLQSEELNNLVELLGVGRWIVRLEVLGGLRETDEGE